MARNPKHKSVLNSSQSNYKIDEKNRQIIEILKADGRASFADIANKLNINESTIRKRINKMAEEGIIDHYTVVLNPKMSEKSIISFLTIIISSEYKINDVSEEVIKFPEVMEAFYMSGKCGFLLKVQVENLNELDKLVDKMRSIHGVVEIENCIVIRQLKIG